MLDAGLVLYFGLLALGIWRLLSGWRLCGAWLVYANYCVLLYLLLMVLMGHAIYTFIHTSLTEKGKHGWHDLPTYMRPLLLGAPAAACIIILLCSFQTAQHVSEIRRGRATLKHDRAVQIIALPAVYGVVAMSSLARMHQLTTGSLDNTFIEQPGNMTLEDNKQILISKSETCFWVGDLYEAWALFQFGRLTLDLIRASLYKMSSSQVEEQRDSARALMTAHHAVESIAWLGVTLFLVVCVLQAGWSLYMLIFTFPLQSWEDYNKRVSQFGAAGMVASAGAIYNVHVVESTFHEYFEGYRPLLKFITVKVIVSLAFFQKGIVWVLKAIQATLPSMMQKVINHVPLIGDLIRFDEVEFQLFYDSLILYECIIIALLHIWGWSAYEDWYLEDMEQEKADEQTPLLQHHDGDAGKVLGAAGTEMPPEPQGYAGAATAEPSAGQRRPPDAVGSSDFGDGV